LPYVSLCIHYTIDWTIVNLKKRVKTQQKTLENVWELWGDLTAILAYYYITFC